MLLFLLGGVRIRTNEGGPSMFWTLAAAGVCAVIVEMMLIHP